MFRVPRVSISMRELDRLKCIQGLIDKQLKQKAVAERLGLTVRQDRRSVERYELEGPRGLISKLRDRPSNRRMKPERAEEAFAIIRAQYADFGPTLASEKLLERHGIEVSNESVRKLMIEAGIWQTRAQRKPKVQQPRLRRPCFGELIQNVTKRYLIEYGKPVAFYSDKHAVFRVNKAGGTRGEGITQFGRALHDLNIESICANSPAAKGRVERANGTLQDRLVKELRLAGISSMAEGNAFLESFRRDYNARFGRAPASDQDAHRKLIKAERVRIDDIFSWQESRAVTRSLTLQYDKVVYLIKPGPENDKIAGQHVTVFDYPDGRFKIRYEGRELPYSVFDRLSQIRQADIVNNKRLGATLTMAREAQRESNERRSKSCPSRPFPSASSMQ